MTYTVASLAREWHCSEGVIRKLIHDGQLGCFRLGTLIRIPAEEVARFQTIQSSGSEADMPSSGATEESAFDTGLRPLIALERRLRRDGFGQGETTVRHGPWAQS